MQSYVSVSSLLRVLQLLLIGHAVAYVCVCYDCKHVRMLCHTYADFGTRWHTCAYAMSYAYVCVCYVIRMLTFMLSLAGAPSDRGPSCPTPHTSAYAISYAAYVSVCYVIRLEHLLIGHEVVPVSEPCLLSLLILFRSSRSFVLLRLPAPTRIRQRMLCSTYAYADGW